MGMLRRKDNGEGKRVNANGKVLSSGAATSRKRDEADDSVDLSSVVDRGTAAETASEWPSIDVSDVERATEARQNGPRRRGARSDPRDGLLG